MKVLLMYRDRDFDLEQEAIPGEQAIIQDLELQIVLDTMAQGDPFLGAVAQKAVLSNCDLDTILYRQAILKDALKNPAIIQTMYDLTIEAIAGEKKIYFGVITYPASILRRSIEVLHLFVALLKKLRTIAQTNRFESEGFLRLFAILRNELSDDYFRTVQNHLDELKFRGGALISAELGKGNKGTNYILHKQDKKYRRALGAKTLHVNDTSGAKILAELRDRGINSAANALAQSVDHILSFFSMLRTELAFYIGCIHLQANLPQTCFPLPIPPTERCHAFQGLYDVSLALTTKQTVVGNAISANQKDLVIITGANQGGKSTFLRSVGLAQVMMQCGMFVGAEYFCANVCNGLFTHFKREEDTTMSSGKLDEELSRLNNIINHLTAHSMVLFNESFAATNEREGSEIAEQIVCAFAESHVKVFFVTHLYEFARDLYDQHLDNALFLRAERQTNGDRTFKMIEGEPLQTSYGKDLYRNLFEVAP